MKVAKFFVDERNAWFDVSHPQWAMANIGSNGSNLTISFLSMNRSALSIRLMRSIMTHVPNFAGRILIADNGSEPNELARVEAFASTECPFPCDILKFGKNYGVAGGRNRAFAEAKTEWILSLDNDIYLTANPFPAIQRDIATLGCHFLSVPLVNADRNTFFSFGGHLVPSFVDQHHPFLGTNCMLPPGAEITKAGEVSADGSGFLCSFLFGGASVLNRDTFLAAGRFDDNMLVGFEDLEFSLRLFRRGLKVGSSTVTDFVHDHPPAEAASDRDYEKTRYSRQVLKESAEYLERKHGFRVWNSNVETWLVDREKEQALTEEIFAPVVLPNSGSAQAINISPRKPRIALVVDMENWAFANIARQIEKHLGDRYEFEIISTFRLAEIEQARWIDRGAQGSFDLSGPTGFGHVLLRAPEFDIIHVFWRPLLTLLGQPNFYGDVLERYSSFLGLNWEEFKARFVEPTWFTTSVYDHLFLAEDERAIMAPVFNEYTAGYTVSSPRLGRIYRELSGVRDPAAVIPDGVDRTLFYPKNTDRFDTVGDREIVIGWVGNSKWGHQTDKKGVHTILKPAVEQLQAEGLKFRLHFADRQDRHVPLHEMVDYYASIDVLLCTSEIEGTPNPVLEALACGVPIISTDVGIVADALGPKQKKFILRERSIAALKDALRRLASRPELFGELSRENLYQAKDWDWEHQTAKFDAFFSGILEQRNLLEGEVRTKMCMLPFTTPSQEPDGSIRLCSASSIFNYRAETNMGNCRTEGLEAVWRGEKYRHVRKTLLAGGGNLTPYCGTCEYRHDGPAWLFQLHLALHVYHNGVRTDGVLRLLRQRIARYDEYIEKAHTLGLSPYPRPDEIAPAAAAMRELEIPDALVDAKDLPIYIDLNTLNRCNVSCVMCPPAIKYDSGLDREEYYRLSVEEFKRLSDGVNIKSAHFVGAYAEPLLNKEIFDLIKTAHDQGAFTAITSNAMPLVPQFAKRLIEAGLDMMSISLHGATKATAESIMLKSNFERVLQNIRVLQNLKKEHGTTKPELYFNFVSQKANAHEIPDFITLARDLGVNHINIIHLIDGDEAVDKTTNLVSYPELLVPNVREAVRRGKEYGLNVYVSPAYSKLLVDYPEEEMFEQATRAA